MDMSAINFLAVFVAALVGFVVGFPWYGPLFGKAWMSTVGLTEEDAAKANMPVIFGSALVMQLIMSFCLAMFFYGDPQGAELINAGNGAFYGFLTGFGWVTMALGVNALFEQKSFKYIAINGGYWIVVFTIMGAVLGAWK
ncbi:MAG: DUF1761 domain-containing protein [Sphingomonadales bacterium]|nr:DUF1761 domain-containing protein [Sphingomonadales bacterium]